METLSSTALGEKADLADRLRNKVVANRYRILRCIGRGGQSLVFEAEHLVAGVRVAVKLLTPWELTDSGPTRSARGAEDRQYQHFLQEARLGMAVPHRNVVRIFDVGADGDFGDFVVLEWLDGQTLGQVARQGLRWERAVELMLQACEGVRALHRWGFLHRDLKADNFMLVRDRLGERVVLIDLGTTRHLPGHAPLVDGLDDTTGMNVGTRSAMAPELLVAPPRTHEATPARLLIPHSVRSEVYGLGVTLYFLLTGRRTHEGATAATDLVLQPIPPPAELGVRLPRALEQLVMAALSKNPSERPASVDEFLVRLQAVITKNEVTRRVPAPASPSTRRRRIGGLGAGLASAAAAAAVVLRLQAGSPPDPLEARLSPEPALLPAPTPIMVTVPDATPAAPTTEAPGPLLARTTPAGSGRAASPARDLAGRLRGCPQAPTGKVRLEYDPRGRLARIDGLPVDPTWAWHVCVEREAGVGAPGSRVAPVL